MPAVKNVGEPCAAEPHARFEVAAGGNQASRASMCRAAGRLSPTLLTGMDELQNCRGAAATTLVRLPQLVPSGSRHAGRGRPRSARRSGRGGLLSTRKAGRTPRAGLRRALPAMQVSPFRPFAEKEAPALAGLRPILGGPKVRSTPGMLALVTQSGGSGWRSASRRSWRVRPVGLRSQAASSPSADD